MEGRNSAPAVDRISTMPDDIIHNVLSYLETKEIMRTTVLSRTWRHKWTLAPKFIVNVELSENQETLYEIAFNILSHHRGVLEKFSVSLQEIENNPRVDLMAYFLAIKGVYDLRFTIEEGEAQPMPNNIFLCQMLRRLELERFAIIPPLGFRGFPNLVKLELRNVVVEKGVLDTIISAGQFLKKLTLVHIGEIDTLNINTPMLTHFYYEGAELRFANFQTPNLEYLVLKIEGDEPKPPNALESGIRVQGFPQTTQFLVLNGKFWKFLGMIKTLLQTRPSSLKNMWLCSVGEICLNDVDEVSCLFKLLQCAPNLKTLYVKCGDELNPDIEQIQALWESQKDIEFCLSNLVTVNLQHFIGSWSQLMLVGFLLESSPLLELMMILPASYDPRYDDSFVTRSVMRYRRISPNAEIIFFPVIFSNNM